MSSIERARHGARTLSSSQPLETTIQSLTAPDPENSGEFRPLTLPEKSRREWGIAALLFVLSVLYLWPFRDYTVLNADEGIALQGAVRILEGEVLYRDFFSFVTPGSYYLLALAFKLFGSSLLVARTLLVVYGGLFSVLTYFLARRFSSRWNSILAAYLLLVTCLPYRFLMLHNWDSTLCALLAIYCAVWVLESPHWAWGFGAGSFLALTFLFEQSKGAGLGVGLILGFGILARIDRPAPFPRRSLVWAAIAGCAWPLVATAAYFAFHHGLGEMLAGWIWPLGHYTAVNRLPYGHHDLWAALDETSSGGQRLLHFLVSSPSLIIPLLPILMAGYLALHTIKIWRKTEIPGRSEYTVLVGAASVGLLFSTLATGRPDLNHLVYLSPTFFVVVAWLVESRGTESVFLAKVQPVLVVYLLLFFTAFALALLWNPLNARHRLETRRGVLRTPGPDSVIPSIQTEAPPGERILIHPYQPLYYFLTGTFSPTRYEYLQPGMHTRDQVLEAARSLQIHPPRVVLFDLSFWGEKIPAAWPGTPLEAMVSDPVQDFIFAYYRPCRILRSDYWRFALLVRKNTSCRGETPK